MSDADEFDGIVGADREKFTDVEYLKTINLRDAVLMAIEYNLSANDKDRFFNFYINVVHAGKTVEELHREVGIKEI